MKNIIFSFAINLLIINLIYAENAQKEQRLSLKKDSKEQTTKSCNDSVCCFCENKLKDNKTLTDICECCKNKFESEKAQEEKITKMVTEIDYEDDQNYIDPNIDNIELDTFSDMSDEQLLNFLNQLSQELNLTEKDSDNGDNPFENIEVSKEDLQQLLGNLTEIKEKSSLMTTPSN